MSPQTSATRPISVDLGQDPISDVVFIAGGETGTWPAGPEVNATVVDVGRGLPVVFLHGLVGLNEHWEGVVERVRTKHRSVLFELPLLRLRGDDCSIQGATSLTARFLREYVREPAV